MKEATFRIPVPDVAISQKTSSNKSLPSSTWLKQHPRFTWHAENLCNQPLNRHCVDDSKMTDHHALIITENYPQRLSLDEQNIYSMIAGRMLEAFSGKCPKKRYPYKRTVTAFFSG